MAGDQKSMLWTYVLWLFGGTYGLHHIYLKRYNHAFLYWCVPGGYFGAGWIRDMWRIPEYVRDHNNDPDFMAALSEKMRKKDKPPFSWIRLMVTIVYSNLFATLMLMAFPDKNDELGPGIDFSLISKVLMPVASAAGIWLVGNIGREQGSFKWPLVGCLLASPLYFYWLMNYHVVTISGITLFNWKAKSWRRKVTKPRNACTSLTILTMCGLLYSSLWMSHLYFNLKIATPEGDEIRFRDAVGNLIKSPAFQQFSNNAKELFEHLKEEGFSSAWEKLILSLDPLGEKNALKVLDLSKGVSQSEIKVRYRELSKKWHPDKFKDEAEKAEAHKRFVEIQQAYETLSDIKMKRKNLNKRSRTASESPADEQDQAGADEQQHTDEL